VLPADDRTFAADFTSLCHTKLSALSCPLSARFS